MKFLVTGATGFLCSYLIPALLKAQIIDQSSTQAACGGVQLFSCGPLNRKRKKEILSNLFSESSVPLVRESNGREEKETGSGERTPWDLDFL